MTERNLPQVEPTKITGRTFFLPHDVEYLFHPDEAIRKIDMLDGGTEQYVVRLGDGM